MPITVKQLVYIHPNREILFRNIDLSLGKGEKAALVGNNGTGKSTLLQILAGQRKAAEGEIIASETPYYVPQHFGQYNNLNIAEALGIAPKLQALQSILDGDASEQHFTNLNDDWEIEERARKALDEWHLPTLPFSQPMALLSGGEKTKVFLAGIRIHQPDIVLLDEPTNHLDATARKQFSRWIGQTSATLLIVSHDRTLLNQLSIVHELTPQGIESYGGNYEFYKEEKEKKQEALLASVEEKEKELRKARRTAQESMERQQKHDSRGEKHNLKKGVPRIAMGNLKSKAEKSSAKLKDVHENKLENLVGDLKELRENVSDRKELKLNFENRRLHRGKRLIQAHDMNFGYTDPMLWEEDRNLEIRSGERIAITGDNGAGKTTLIRLLLGQLEPTKGSVERADFSFLYLDQDYSLIDNRLTVYEQLSRYNAQQLQEHELKIILHRFLFDKESWDKPCSVLSGGEKMRLFIACLQVSNRTPDVFVLDEPSNNLDISSLEILTNTIRQYEGTLLVISHDTYFLDEIGVERVICQ